MSDVTGSSGPVARYIAVDGVDYALVAGCKKTFRKLLIATERLMIQQTRIEGVGDVEGFEPRAEVTAAYVLAGTMVLKDRHRTPVREGHLLVIPAGARLGEQLSSVSEEVVLLEIGRAGASSAHNDVHARIRAVDPEDVEQYEPAGHAKTLNRCLFVDDHVEIIEGKIDRGGGAEQHAHSDNEQFLYVLSGVGVPLLIHYPKGAPHGTGGGIPEPLKLLVIYSPPLGESHNALG